jgi:hypothetical protein
MKNFMKIRPGVAKWFHADKRMERRRGRDTERERQRHTDTTKLIAGFHNFAKAPKNGRN